MKERYRMFLMTGILTASVFLIPCCAQAGEGALTENGLTEESAGTAESGFMESDEVFFEEGESFGSTGTDGQQSGGLGELVIESLEVVSAREPSEEEQKAVEEIKKEARKRDEKKLQELQELAQQRRQQMEGFHVNPLDYPPADISENTQKIYRYLTEELELNHAAACGVLANVHLESSFFPLALGDGGTSYGICQWHLGRFRNLILYCNVHRLDYNTLDGQLCYLKYELQGGYKGILDYLREVPDTKEGAYAAAYRWCVGFEMPDDMYYRGARRGNLAANEYYPKNFEEEAKKDESKETESGSEEKPDAGDLPDMHTVASGVFLLPLASELPEEETRK